MRMGRPIPELKITREQHQTLEEWSRRPKTAQALAQRARIILACAKGQTNTDVARQFGVTKQMVGKWRSRFVEKGVNGLLDEPRPGTPKTS